MEKREQRLTGDDYLTKLLTARYQAESAVTIDAYYEARGTSEAVIQELFMALRQTIAAPSANKDFNVPTELVSNNAQIREIILKQMDALRENGTPSAESFRNFFLTQHEFIKYAQEQFILANPGVILELFTVPNLPEEPLREWLQQTFNVNPGDTVIHRHVVSANGRARLQKAGFNVPHSHWDKSYVVDALQKSATLLEQNPDSKGIISMGSWIYDPMNYDTASDGRPYVSFDFLRDDSLTGYRFDLGAAKDHEIYQDQLQFALRNPRRRVLFAAGEFNPHVVATFYPRDEVVRVTQALESTS